MNNDLGRTNAPARGESREPRAVRAAPAGAPGRLPFAAPPPPAPEPRPAEALNGPLNNRLLSALPAEDFSRLFPHLEPVSLAAGEVLYKLDAEMRHAYFPETAVVSHVYILSEGGMTESDMVGREGMTGLTAVFDVPAPSYVTEVALAGSALRARVDVLRQEFARGGAFQRLLLRYTQALLTQMSQTAVCNRLHAIEQQLCRWLLLSHDRLGSDELVMTQELIANMLGVRREGVTAAAGRLQERGLIGYSRGRIRILDRRGLEEAACECYGVVRGEYDRLLG